MSLHFGRTLLSIPGPSVIPERVLRAMNRSSPNIYEGELVDMTASILPDLKKVAKTDHDVAIYIANGHGAWEAAISNTLAPGDKALVLGAGRFAVGWGELTKTMGVDIEVMDFGMQECVDPDMLADRLCADKNGEIKAILTVQSDTASSVQNNIPALRRAIDIAAHDALFMVDCIASLGTERHEMDNWGVDVMVSACQKGLMTPAGISFVYYNDKAARIQKTVSPSWYWNWEPRSRPNVFYEHFGGTAPTHHVYALREALDMIIVEEGIENVWARHDTFAHAVWAAIDVWGAKGSMNHNISDPANRSRAVSTITTGPTFAGKIRNWCEHHGGVTLGIGLGMANIGTPEWDMHFRIGHMGHLNVPMVMGTLGAIDAAMKVHDIPHGDNALAAASQIIANHKG